MSPLRAPTVLLLDVDGTLVDYRGNLPASARRAIEQAKANGHLPYLCTGRAKGEIYPQLWELGLAGAICGNGCHVESGGEVVRHLVLASDVVRRGVAWLTKRGAGLYLECNSGLYAHPGFLQKACQALGGDPDEARRRIIDWLPGLVEDSASGWDDANKVSFVLEPGIDLDELAAVFAGEAKIDTWSMSGVRHEFGEIGQLGVTKGAGVEVLAGHLGVDPSQFIAFGDAPNDLEMLSVCGIGVAMGDAPAEVKAVADLVTDTVSEDGLANAFARLGLI